MVWGQRKSAERDYMDPRLEPFTASGSLGLFVTLKNKLAYVVCILHEHGDVQVYTCMWTCNSDVLTLRVHVPKW